MNIPTYKNNAHHAIILIFIGIITQYNPVSVFGKCCLPASSSVIPVNYLQNQLITSHYVNVKLVNKPYKQKQ